MLGVSLIPRSIESDASSIFCDKITLLSIVSPDFVFFASGNHMRAQDIEFRMPRADAEMAVQDSTSTQLVSEDTQTGFFCQHGIIVNVVPPRMRQRIDARRPHHRNVMLVMRDSPPSPAFIELL